MIWSKATIASMLTLFAVSAVAHTSMGFPPPRSSPINRNARNIDYECLMAPLNGGAGCPAAPFPCKGYSKDSRITTVLKAGELIEVSFYNQNFPNGPRSGDENRDQARHSGGLCQFSLSIDDGKTFKVIGEYTRGCPDIFYKFPLRIPSDIPSRDSAIFAWTWINASGNREFYMNCADVRLEGVAGGSLTGPEIRKANLPSAGFREVFTPQADMSPPSNSRGPGPSDSEKRKNSSFKGISPSPLQAPPPLESSPANSDLPSPQFSPAVQRAVIASPSPEGVEIVFNNIEDESESSPAPVQEEEQIYIENNDFGNMVDETPDAFSTPLPYRRKKCSNLD